MRITNLSLSKVDHADPIYPDPMEHVTFSDVYLLVASLDDGSTQHAPFYVNGDMTPEAAASMLSLLAKSVAEMQDAKAA